MANKNNVNSSSKALESARSFVLTILVIVLFSYALFANLKGGGQALPMIFGKGAAVVMSGSMEPNIPLDALIFVDESNDYQVGDIVVIEKPGHSLVVHRIITIDGDDIITKGDANNVADEPIKLSDIKGEVFFYIPYVGYAINFLKTPLGSMLLLFIVFFILFASAKSKDNDDDSSGDSDNADSHNTVSSEQGGSEQQ